MLGNPDLRRAYDASRGVVGPAGDPGSPPRSAAAGGASSGRAPLQSWSGLIAVLLLVAALPLLLRVFRSPRSLAFAGLVVALVWFGPRILRYFQR